MAGLPPPQAILRVKDVQESARFYRDTLGFGPISLDAVGDTARVTVPDGPTLILAGRSADLAAWPQVKLARPGAWIYLRGSDLQIKAAVFGVRHVVTDDLQDPYPGFRRLLLSDPDGYVVVFWETLPLTDEEVVAIYRSGPERLRQALEGLPPAGLEWPWAKGKRTIREVVHHLVEADLGTLRVLQMACADSGRQIGGEFWDDDVAEVSLAHAQRPVEPAVAVFAALRGWVLDLVDHLPDALDRHIVWPSGGRADVRSLLRHVGGHALHHIDQIEQARRRHG